MSRTPSSLFPALLLALALSPFVHGEPPVPGRSDAHGDPLPPGAVARLGTVRLRHGGQLAAVAFSPDGKTVASGACDKTVRLWDVSNGREIRRFSGLAWPGSLAFTADGKTLAAGDYAEPFNVCLWDTATGKVLRMNAGHTSPVKSVAFSPKGDVLASGSWDKTLRLWEVATGRQLFCVQQDAHDGVNVVAFAPDGKTLASGSRHPNLDGVAIDLWDVASGQLTGRLEGHKGSITALAFLAGGTLLASAGEDGTQRLWDVQTGKEIQQLTHQGEHLAVSADGKILVSVALGEKTQEVHVRESRSGKDQKHFPTGQQRLNSLALSPDGRIVATTDNSDCAVFLWDIATGKPLLPLSGHVGQVRDVAYCPDGRTVASTSYDGTVRLWDTASWTERRCYSTGQPSAQSVAVSADGKFLAAGGNQGIICLWDLAGPAEPRRLRGHSDWVFSLSFAPDGKTLASVSRKDEVLLHATATGELQRRIQVPELNNLYAVAFSPDGRLLATGDENGRVQLWNSATWQLVHTLDGHGGGYIHRVTFSPDGSVLASIGYDASIRLWTAATGSALCCVQLEQPFLHGLAFAPDGRSLATGGSDGTVRIWETATGKERRRFMGHQGSVFAVAFAPDGRTVVSAGEDTSLLVWDVTGRDRDPEPTVPVLLDRREVLWAALTSADAGRAYQALWQLAQTPGESVAFLRQQLRPSRFPSGEKLTRLLADLDNDDFAVRNRASAELEQLGEAAEASLRKLLKDPPSTEVRVRAEQLLAKREKATLSPQELRILRALELLEQVGTAEARQVLEVIAQGAPEARLTREAKQSLERLAKQQKSGR